MRRLRSGFALEVFDHQTAKSKRLAIFLALYVQHFGPEHRTSTNELVEFLMTPPPDRTITYFGLTYNDEPSGFATFMHYPSGPIGIIDHLVLSPSVRGYGAFFCFCDLVAGYFEQRRIIFDHLVAEVMLSEKQIASTIKPLILVRLMRMVGFRIAKIPYWAPDPLIINDTDQCRAALLLASQPERDELSATELKRLVEIIYNIHYGKWYERTMNQIEYASYKIAAHNTLSKILTQADKIKRVRLNGMKNLDLQFILDPNPKINFSSSTYIGLSLIPTFVGVAVAFAEERWTTISAIFFSFVVLAIFIANPRLRRFLINIFRLSE